MKKIDDAMLFFREASDRVNKESTNLNDLGFSLYFLAEGFKHIALAIQQTYDKLAQIDRKLSSAPPTYKRPSM